MPLNLASLLLLLVNLHFDDNDNMYPHALVSSHIFIIIPFRTSIVNKNHSRFKAAFYEQNK